MVDSQTATALNEARKAAGSEMDDYFEAHYPFSEETYEEYVRLSTKFTQAVEEWMKRCAPHWRK